MQNNHNTALCKKEVKKEITDNGVCVTTSREHVFLFLLQTAEGYVTAIVHHRKGCKQVTIKANRQC